VSENHPLSFGHAPHFGEGVKGVKGGGSLFLTEYVFYSINKLLFSPPSTPQKQQRRYNL